eukprot:1161512-Pelagomonas_calceolata.AAC.18
MNAVDSWNEHRQGLLATLSSVATFELATGLAGCFKQCCNLRARVMPTQGSIAMSSSGFPHQGRIEAITFPPDTLSKRTQWAVGLSKPPSKNPS